MLICPLNLNIGLYIRKKKILVQLFWLTGRHLSNRIRGPNGSTDTGSRLTRILLGEWACLHVYMYFVSVFSACNYMILEYSFPDPVTHSMDPVNITCADYSRFSFHQLSFQERIQDLAKRLNYGASNPTSPTWIKYRWVPVNLNVDNSNFPTIPSPI